MKGKRIIGEGIVGIIVEIPLTEVIVLKDLCNYVGESVETDSPAHKLIQIVSKITHTGLNMKESLDSLLNDEEDIFTTTHND